MQDLAIFVAAMVAGAALGGVVLRFGAPELLGRLAAASAPSAPEPQSATAEAPPRARPPAPAGRPDPPKAVAEPEPRAEALPAPGEPAPSPEPAPPVPQPETGTETETDAADPKAGNRRKDKRIVSDEQIMVTPFGGRETMAEVCDVSLGGVRFRVVGITLRPDEMLRVTFNLGGESLSAVARVLRIQPLDDITSEVAAVFARLDPWAARRFEAALAEES